MLDGGPKSIIAVFIVVIALLIFDRRRLLNDLKEKDGNNRKEVLELIEKYHKSKADTNDALHSVMLVLTKIEMKM